MSPFWPAFCGNLHDRRPAGTDDDVVADLFVVLQTLGLQAIHGPQQGHAAAGKNAFLDCGAGGVHGVLDAGLLLLHLALGGGPDVDLGHAARQLGDALRQLFLVVVAGGLF